MAGRERSAALSYFLLVYRALLSSRGRETSVGCEFVWLYPCAGYLKRLTLEQGLHA